MFKEAFIVHRPEALRTTVQPEAWYVYVDNELPVKLQDLQDVHAYLCGYPWPKRGT